MWLSGVSNATVKYEMGIGFEAEDNSLILVDESDRLMFENPAKFKNFVNKKFCICFTATPNNWDEKDVEAAVIKALRFD